MTAFLTGFAIGIVLYLIGFSLGWRARDRQKQKMAEDIRELKILLTGHVHDAEVIEQ